MLDIKIKYVFAYLDIYVIFHIKNFDIKIKPKSDISINALVCGCVRWCAVVCKLILVSRLNCDFLDVKNWDHYQNALDMHIKGKLGTNIKKSFFQAFEKFDANVK